MKGEEWEREGIGREGNKGHCLYERIDAVGAMFKGRCLERRIDS